MSLSLVQAYSSAEEEEEEAVAEGYEHSDDDGVEPSTTNTTYKSSLIDLSTHSSAASQLPSAFDAFSQVSGPPKFLNSRVDADEEASARDAEHQQETNGARKKKKKNKKDLRPGVVVEAKAQLVGIQERVRSDIVGSQPIPQSGVKRVATAANPNAEDAAELLRMCLQCGIPKTYTSARGMICPACGDRPRSEPETESKKKGSAIKDKEKNKRMKGQSSHATWKSETEMQLRQQFD